jgi:hypothetical protein
MIIKMDIVEGKKIKDSLSLARKRITIRKKKTRGSKSTRLSRRNKKRRKRNE